MTTHPAPAPDNRIDVDTLRPEERAYVDRLSTALRCGVPGCSCSSGNKFHCPAHPNPEIATLTVGFTRGYGYSFHCTRCPLNKILEALARRGLAPESELFTSAGAQEAGLDPFSLFIPQPPDWLWPNRIPLGQLTLIAGYPSSGKTSIALDIAARVSRGAPAPDQHGAAFPNAPVLLASFNGNPKASVLPILRAFGANLGARTRAAQAFITRALADGPKPAAAIEREAAMQGISRRTLFRARALCDVRSTRIGDSRGPGSGAWQWSLPQRNTLQQDATPDERSNS